MAPFALPAQYQNVNGATIGGFNATNPDSFLTNFNNASVLYSDNAANDAQQLNNLISAYQYLSDPQNQATEDAANGQGWSKYMLGQLQSDITEQNNLARYYGANYAQQIGQKATDVGNVGDVNNIQLPDQGTFQALVGFYRAGQQNATLSQIGANIPGVDGNTTVGQYVDNIANAIENSNSNLARTAANSAAGNAKGFELGATEGNLGEHLKGQSGAGSVDPSALANWMYGYIQAAQQGYQGLTQLQDQQNQGENAILKDFYLNQPNYQGNLGQLEQYYGIDANGNQVNPQGQVQIAQRQANNDIYQQAHQLRQQLNQQAVQTGTTSSGERQLALGNIESDAAEKAAGIYQQDANAAEQAINNYNQQLQKEELQRQQQQQAVQAGNLSNLMNSSTQGTINNYNQNQSATNQTNLTSEENAVNQAKQNSSLWNGIGSTVGGAIGTVAGTALAPKI